MTPQNEAQMKEEFEKCDHVIKYQYPLGKERFGSYSDGHTLRLFMGFKSAYSLQQEKIDKLEKKNEQLKRFWEPVISKFEGTKFSTAPNKIALESLTEAFDIFSENEELKEENKSLRSDLAWAIASSRFYIKNWYTGSGLESIREKDARKCDEIRTRHKLDEVKE